MEYIGRICSFPPSTYLYRIVQHPRATTSYGYVGITDTYPYPNSESVVVSQRTIKHCIDIGELRLHPINNSRINLDKLKELLHEGAN